MSITDIKTKAKTLTDTAQELVNPYELSAVAMVAGVVLIVIGWLSWSGICLVGVSVFLVGLGFSTREAQKRKELEALEAKNAPEDSTPEPEVGHD